MTYHLSKPDSPPTPFTPMRGLIISSTKKRYFARQWHQNNPDFMLKALKSLGRCQDDAEVGLAHAYHAEALEIGFWSKKDIVQYVVACLHAQGSMIMIASFRQFLDQFTEADKNIMQQYIEATPIHYWTDLSQKIDRTVRQDT